MHAEERPAPFIEAIQLKSYIPRARPAAGLGHGRQVGARAGQRDLAERVARRKPGRRARECDPAVAGNV